jgi:hypothetical protein
MDCVSECFEEHRAIHQSRLPPPGRIHNKDEGRQIGPDEGLFEFDFPPAKDIVEGKAPSSRADLPETNKTKYLWVVATSGVPAALEHPTNGTTLESGRLTHTNLTGAAEGHTAGELWFYDTSSIIINGGSSRYTPRSSEELNSAAQSFKSAGYKVANMGWDESGPVRLLRGEPEWI